MLSKITVFNSSGSANGPAIWLEGKGTGFGYTEQIAIDGLREIGGATDILSVHTLPPVLNCGIVTLTNSLLMNFSGYVVNNVGHANSFVIAHCIVVGEACGAFTGAGVTWHLLAQRNVQLGVAMKARRQ